MTDHAEGTQAGKVYQDAEGGMSVEVDSKGRGAERRRGDEGVR